MKIRLKLTRHIPSVRMHIYKIRWAEGQICSDLFRSPIKGARHLGAYSQNSNVSHHLSATLTVSPSEHLILDSQQNLRQTLTLVTYVSQNQLIPLA